MHLLLLFSLCLPLTVLTHVANGDTYKSCEWFNRAPFCGGAHCPEDRILLKSAKSSDERGFGSACWTGIKNYCCKDFIFPPHYRDDEQCEWLGTAPLCGEPTCPEGKSIVEKADNHDNANKQFRDFFGKDCFTGFKIHCCPLHFNVTVPQNGKDAKASP